MLTILPIHTSLSSKMSMCVFLYMYYMFNAVHEGIWNKPKQQICTTKQVPTLQRIGIPMNSTYNSEIPHQSSF